MDSGDVIITIWAGKCRDMTIQGSCHFGWKSYQHMLISETYAEREIVDLSTTP